MARSKQFDNQVFKSAQTHVLNYLTHLYDKSELVESYLRRKCAIGTIEEKTHLEIFTMIEEELGIPIP
ncbi:hypothetical protein E9993_13630 [Labilibacter sediminis]|nr:hypothetical protein E9993_13630 [Labilibacter sediminis]